MSSQENSDQAPQNINQPPMLVHSQYIRDLSFENPKAPNPIASEGEPPAVNVQVDVKLRNLQENVSEVALDLRVEAKQKEQTVFLVELTYGGVFEITEAAGDLGNQYIGIEAPHFLFPFARAIIADVTRDGGFPPLLINPIDFRSLYVQRLEAEQKSSTSS